MKAASLTQLPHALYPWQHPLWSQLVTHWQSQRVGHALLFKGQAGIGKASFVQTLAHFFLCQQPLTTTYCGTCRACHLIKAQAHPDLLWLAPEEKSASIKVDQVRAFCTKLTQKAQQGQYRIGIINSLDQLTHASANSLLKTLEEPAPQVIMLLIDHQTTPLMPTIGTRCQKISCQKPTLQAASAWLIEQGIPPDIAARLLAFSGGAPLKALAMADTPIVAMGECLLRLLTQQVAADDETTLYGLLKTLGLDQLLDIWMCLMQSHAAIPLAHRTAFWTRLLDARRDLIRGKGNLNAQLQCQALLAQWKNYATH